MCVLKSLNLTFNRMVFPLRDFSAALRESFELSFVSSAIIELLPVRSSRNVVSVLIALGLRRV